MALTLKQLSKISEDEIRECSRPNSSKAIASINARLKEIETKLKMSSVEILRLQEDDYSKEVKQWLKLYSAVREIESNPSPCV